MNPILAALSVAIGIVAGVVIGALLVLPFYALIFSSLPDPF